MMTAFIKGVRSRMALAIIGLAYAATAVLAQQPEDPPQEQPVAESAGNNTAPKSSTEGDDGAELPAENDQAPQDYEASEQISEDLSVSFPVDI